MEKSQLLKYLGAVRDLEGIVYVHEQSINKLNQQYRAISARINGNDYEKPRKHTYDQYDIPPQSNSESIKKGLVTFAVLAVILSIVSCIAGPILATFANGLDVTTDEVGSTIVILVIISVFLSAIFGLKTAKDCIEQYGSGSEKWRQIEAYNREIKEKNAQQRGWDNHQLKLIPQETKLLNANLTTARRLLWDYYRLGILHSDYQNMVAVCSIYQYIDSGRCSELTGRDGAYNLFEEEKFKNIVISKLDEIIRRLDQLQRTQSQLYYLMRDCESQIYQLSTATQKLSTKLDSIQESAAITAYNTTYLKQNEEYRVLLHGF